MYPYTQWLMIIIPMKNGYFIGNIPHFQTSPNPEKSTPLRSVWRPTSPAFGSANSFGNVGHVHLWARLTRASLYSCFTSRSGLRPQSRLDPLVIRALLWKCELSRVDLAGGLCWGVIVGPNHAALLVPSWPSCRKNGRSSSSTISSLATRPVWLPLYTFPHELAQDFEDHHTNCSVTGVGLPWFTYLEMGGTADTPRESWTHQPSP